MNMSKINKKVLVDQIYRKATDIGSFFGGALSLPLIYFFVQSSSAKLEFTITMSFGIFLIFKFLGWFCGWIVGLRAISSDQNVKKN